MWIRPLILGLGVGLLFGVLSSAAKAEKAEKAKEIKSKIETITILGNRKGPSELPGSAHVVHKKTLEKFKHSDPHQVLKDIPGVYIQEEDGFGLRPNIGLRGAHPHRSRKVTLLEDGLLIGPAPYSAPAAYFFPNMLRMEAVEVYKGPAAVRYGPNSLGGAINMRTHSIARERMHSEVDLSDGASTPHSRPHRTFRALISGPWKTGGQGEGEGPGGGLIQATRLHSDGIKTLPRGDPTGFKKDDIMGKIRWYWPGNHRHRFDLKLGYSHEKSHETYLGLTRLDFLQDPYQRYGASHRDLLTATHRQGQLRYHGSLSSGLSLSMALYHHHFSRKWFKFNRLKNRPRDLNALPLDDLRLLRGEVDSVAADGSDLLPMGNNDRKYFSQGIFLQIHPFVDGPNATHDIHLGLRLHRDRINRNQTEVLYAMAKGTLQETGKPIKAVTVNNDTSLGHTLFLEDEVSFAQDRVKLTLGARLEQVRRKRVDHLQGKGAFPLQNSDTQLIPGANIFWKTSREGALGLLLGVNRGVVLATPGDPEGRPEESLNYEGGVRYNGPFRWEAIAFFSDYKNIKGTCSLSSGCGDTATELDREFNGGKAAIYGVESSIEHIFSLSSLSPGTAPWRFPIKASYTKTVAQFQGLSFSNDNPEWGPKEETIRRGDPLPYIPREQFALSLGVARGPWAMDISLNYRGAMFDQAVALGRKTIEENTVVSEVLRYHYTTSLGEGHAYFRLDNIFNETTIVSFRPMGARPGKPRTLLVGLTHRF